MEGKNVIKAVMLLLCSMMIFAGCKKEKPDNGGNGGVTITSVTDADGNVYKAVTIGTQTWMAENLKTTKYKDGTSIPNVTDGNEWDNLSTPAYCWYNNDSATYYNNKYGALYNWYAVNTGNLCPTGWHVPSDDELTVLADYLHTQGYNESNNAIPLKSTSGWNDFQGNSGNGTDVYDFTALPAGCRLFYGDFYYKGDHGGWWSATEYNDNNALYCTMSYDEDDVSGDTDYLRHGNSVRCLRN